MTPITSNSVLSAITPRLDLRHTESAVFLAQEAKHAWKDRQLGASAPSVYIYNRVCPHADRTATPARVGTVFSVQSISKNFTAAAVLLAVQEGLLDLDTPITTYLPDFTVHGIFEDHPERKITLRMLLSHTAGFTHETPIGNNFDLGSVSFEDHIKSISDTWLRFPVGTGFLVFGFASVAVLL